MAGITMMYEPGSHHEQEHKHDHESLFGGSEDENADEPLHFAA